ncbi:MAG: shikimate dehydrogenase [Clostridia bacterium]|nr:shikimate dehydrogenase [Clostridia bacterium]
MSPYKNRELPISVNTRLAALIGWPLGHSASAEMHNDAYGAMGLDAIYLPLPVKPENVDSVVRAMETMGFMGFNVTIPHKVAVKELMDELHPTASESGAVNTVLFKDGRRIGYNTDGTGFVHALIEKGGFNPSGKSCLMIGAGGAARGVASALAIAGVSNFFVANRAEEYEMAERLSDDMNALRPGTARALALDTENVKAALADTDFVVHATRLGMSPNENTVAFDTSLLSSRHFVCDVVYSPRETRLLREAAANGCRTLDGMWMLVYQGAEAVRIWTGMEPPLSVMAAGCERFLNDSHKS